MAYNSANCSLIEGVIYSRENVTQHPHTIARHRRTHRRRNNRRRSSEIGLSAMKHRFLGDLADWGRISAPFSPVRGEIPFPMVQCPIFSKVMIPISITRPLLAARIHTYQFIKCCRECDYRPQSAKDVHKMWFIISLDERGSNSSISFEAVLQHARGTILGYN